MSHDFQNVGLVGQKWFSMYWCRSFIANIVASFITLHKNYASFVSIIFWFLHFIEVTKYDNYLTHHHRGLQLKQCGLSWYCRNYVNKNYWPPFNWIQNLCCRIQLVNTKEREKFKESGNKFVFDYVSDSSKAFPQFVYNNKKAKWAIKQWRKFIWTKLTTETLCLHYHCIIVK